MSTLFFISLCVFVALPLRHTTTAAPAVPPSPSSSSQITIERVQLLSESTGWFVAIDSNGQVNANEANSGSNSTYFNQTTNQTGTDETVQFRSLKYPDLVLAINSSGSLIAHNVSSSGTSSSTVVTTFTRESVEGSLKRIKATVNGSTCYVAFEFSTGLSPSNVCQSSPEFEIQTYITIVTETK